MERCEQRSALQGIRRADYGRTLAAGVGGAAASLEPTRFRQRAFGALDGRIEDQEAMPLTIDNNSRLLQTPPPPPPPPQNARIAFLKPLALTTQNGAAPTATQAPAVASQPPTAPTPLGAAPTTAPVQTTAQPAYAVPQTPANLSQPPFGFPNLAYTSDPTAALVPNGPDTPAYVHGGIGTPPEVGQLMQAGGANFLNPQWQAMVADHAARNGGLGNEKDGFLAVGKDGFVRFYNENLSPEQNRRMAEISLQTGWPIDKMPSRADEAGENIDRWANKFLERFDREFAAFQADPMGHKMTVRDGKKRFVLDFNEQAQAFVSYNYKKSGGLRGFVQDNFKYIAPVLNVLTAVGGPITAGIAFAARAAVSYIATGALKVRDVVAAGVNFFLPNGASTLTQAAVQGGAQFAGSVIDNGGKITAGSLLDGLKPALGFAGYEDLVKAGGVLAKAIDTGKFDAGKLLGIAAETFGPEIGELLKDSPLDFFGGLAKAVDQGAVGGKEAESFFGRLIDTVRDDKALRELLKAGGKAAFDAVRGKKVKAEDVFAALADYVATTLRGDDKKVAATNAQPVR